MSSRIDLARQSPSDWQAPQAPVLAIVVEASAPSLQTRGERPVPPDSTTPLSRLKGFFTRAKNETSISSKVSFLKAALDQAEKGLQTEEKSVRRCSLMLHRAKVILYIFENAEIKDGIAPKVLKYRSIDDLKRVIEEIEKCSAPFSWAAPYLVGSINNEIASLKQRVAVLDGTSEPEREERYPLPEPQGGELSSEDASLKRPRAEDSAAAELQPRPKKAKTEGSKK